MTESITHPWSLDSNSKEGAGEQGGMVKDGKAEKNSISSSVYSSVNKDQGEPVLKYTAENVKNVKPPTFGQRIKRFFFERGLADMPAYLTEMYSSTPRYIYVNQDLPEFLKNPRTGYPLILYPRNKIRTTKYTPLTFLPKNIVHQFTNVANSYFLLLVILGAFSIFGVQSPGLAAVPLVVIVGITALRDAIEDYRRAYSDSDLNNSPIHLLGGLENPNVLVDHVGNWRKFKKKCTKITRATLKGIKKYSIMIFAKKRVKQDYIRNERIKEDNELHRVSTVVSDYTYQSSHAASVTNKRRSMQSRRSNKFTKPKENSLLNPTLFGSERPQAKFKNRCWKDINIGDFIRIRDNEEVPADVIVISTSDPEGNCFIETKNLDGETNLKTRTALQCGGNNQIKHAGDLANTKFWVECDPPNGQLYSFRGTVHYENYDEKGNLVNPDERESLSLDNVLLRGCCVKNTRWVIGLVLYTGSETKVMLNSGITPTKTSKISRELNLSVFINFLLLFILCFVSGLINGLFYNKTDVSRMYFDFRPYGSNSASRGVIAFFVALIIYQSLVPISLYISVEIIKTLQAYFIYSDVKMYYPRLDFPCVPKSWNVSDDLGQIEYVFSDKTGTLTQNVMEFKKCSINGKSYGLAYTEAQQGLDKRDGKDIIHEKEYWNKIIAKDKEEMLLDLIEYSNNDQLVEERCSFISSNYVKDTIIPTVESGPVQKKANEDFMLALALCHTIITDRNEANPQLLEYKAESPDEAALVAAARDVGIVFRERLRKSLIVSIYGVDYEYALLAVIPFTSARKRMSCIVRTPLGKIMLISKGADNIMFSRLSPKNGEDLIKRTAIHIETYANEGLRTLCIAQKELDPKYVDQWMVLWKEASASIDENRGEELDRLYDEIETDLTLLGGTAIEDRLQMGVPDAISILSNAGIKLWVLTGDRIETAINIGFSCNLLENKMKLLVVRPDPENPENVEYIDDLITRHLQENFNMLTEGKNSGNDIDACIKEMKKDHSIPSQRYATVIDGEALSMIFTNFEEDSKFQYLQKKFLMLGKQCKSVICCRVSPSQKAAVVKMVKESLDVMTLAIGDGANDVAMIQAANIGIGIAGEEGRQAVMSSDYAIGQFRFLARLLLVHGRWSYKRLAEMVPCFFYKNVVFTLTCFWYGIYNNFDGSYLYEYTYLMFYNLAFTSLPVIVLAVLDQDVSDTVSLLVPQLYKSGILGIEWSQYKFVWYMLDGLYQSVISFYFPYLLFYKGFQSEQGLSVDHRFFVGVVCACISVTACNIYVLLQQYRWDWLTLLIDILSILVVFFWTGVWSTRVYAGEFYKAGAIVLGTLSCWCVMFIAILVCVLPRFTYDFLKKNLKPRDIDIIRERALSGEYDDYPEAFDPTDIDDLERLKLVARIKNNPEALSRIEKELQSPTSGSLSSGSIRHNNTLKKTFKTIKKRTTIRSRKNTTNEAINTINKLDLNQLRLEMMKEGAMGSLSMHPLERINTTQELPGLSTAETLLSYHTGSIRPSIDTS